MSSNDWPPKFTLDGQQILRLLTGDRFYSSADAAIREAILNAIDACGRRRIIEPALYPSIEVLFDEQSKTVAITDNGDGMTREDVRDLFVRVGASASRLIGQDKYKAIGEFGIGVVSYFLVCDRFQVHTLKHGSHPIGLQFDASMLDTETSASEVPPRHDSVGTKLVIFVRNESLFKLLLDKYPHWVRDVQGLTARKLPEDTLISQGGRRTHITPVRIPAHPGRRFRSMPASRSGNGRPPVPAQAGHRGSV